MKKRNKKLFSGCRSLDVQKFFGPFFQKRIAFFLFFSFAAQATDCKMALVSVLPLGHIGSSPTVEARLNGGRAQLIFDTGSFTSLLSTRAVNRLGLPVLRSEEFDSVRGKISGLGGARSAIAVMAHTVELGNLHARDYNFISADINMPLADGLLSADLVSNFDIDLDFPDQVIKLFRPTGDCSAPAAFLSNPLYVVPLEPNGEDRRPRIRVTLGGVELVALVDTGADHTSIFRSVAKRLGLLAGGGASEAEMKVSGVGPGTVSARRHVFDSLSVGDLSFDHMPIDILDERSDDDVQMVLGADFQQLVHVWISYSSHSLILEYPSQPSKKVPGN